MTIYLTLFAFISYLYIFMDKERFSLFFACTILLLFIGLRAQVGGDWQAYSDWYSAIALSDDWRYAWSFTEPLYGVLNLLAYKLDLGIYFVNFVCGILFMLGLWKFCVAQDEPFLALLIALPYLVFVVAMGYTRQSVAIGLSLWALTALLNRQLFLFIALIIVASLFHVPSIILLSLLVMRFRLTRKNFLWSFLVSALLLILVLSYWGEWIMGRLSFYVASDLVSSGAQIRLLISVLAFIIFIMFSKAFRVKNVELFYIVIYSGLINCMLLILSFFASTVADRLGLYFLYIQILVFANLPATLNMRYRKSFIIMLLTCYVAVLIVWLKYSFHAQNFWIPYDNLLFHIF